jgi:hypothetical protein
MGEEAQTQETRIRAEQSGGGCERIVNAGRRAWGYFWGYARPGNQGARKGIKTLGPNFASGPDHDQAAARVRRMRLRPNR